MTPATIIHQTFSLWKTQQQLRNEAIQRGAEEFEVKPGKKQRPVSAWDHPQRTNAQSH